MDGLAAERVYLAGPMRGIPDFNFPAFFDAADDLRDRGYQVFNPAEHDMARGFDTGKDSEELTLDELREVFAYDMRALATWADGIVLLPGFRQSNGARAEYFLSRALGYPAFLYFGRYQELHLAGPEGAADDEDILHEAYRLTTGERNNSYGPPTQDFERTAKIWSAVLGKEVTAAEVALCMIGLKISRATWSDKRDNYVDIAGYARCGWLCVEE